MTLRTDEETGNYRSTRFVPVVRQLYGDGMEGNHILKKRMAEMGFTQEELAEAVNADQRASGYEGTVSDRTVRNWVTGKTRWPRSRQREALEAVFKCPVTELGFRPRGESSRTAPREDTVLRRHFISTSAGAGLAATGTLRATPTPTARPRVGNSDVERLYVKLAALIARDDRYGGRISIESHASDLAQEALALLQRRTASQRVRNALYGCAASFISCAMWAAIDGCRFKAALAHFDRASSLASLSGDPAIQFRIWSHASMLYRRLDRPWDALAANDVARSLSITRRDPMFASLGLARHAVIHGFTGDKQGARRAIGHAQEALGRAAPDTHRPVWLNFYDQAELDSLAMGTYLAVRDCQTAEAHAHRSLALLRSDMPRNQAVTTASLACAQLGQSDHESAVATAMSIPTEFAGHPRVSGMLQDFGTTLRASAPTSPFTKTWDEFIHNSQRNSQ